jgi:hypothetical protein
MSAFQPLRTSGSNFVGALINNRGEIVGSATGSRGALNGNPLGAPDRTGQRPFPAHSQIMKIKTPRSCKPFGGDKGSPGGDK